MTTPADDLRTRAEGALEETVKARSTTSRRKKPLGYVVVDNHGDLCTEGLHPTLDAAQRCASEQGYIDRDNTIALVYAVERHQVPAWPFDD